MAIIPGGTANVVAHELGIPLDVMEATILAINREAPIRKVDMGKIGQHHFLIRAGMGFEAAMIEGADRESKDRFGLLAYALSALQELADPEIARYQMVLDGQYVEAEGLACIIANSGNIGRPGILIQPSILVSDGRLDIVVITRSDLPTLVALAASIVGGAQNQPALQHWQVKEARIASNPRQKVQVDGEILYETPIEVTVVPQAVSIITPPAVSPD
jgi:diacylglycerol kinase (ATP)